MDIKTTFLYIGLDEEIFVDQLRVMYLKVKKIKCFDLNIQSMD